MCIAVYQPVIKWTGVGAKGDTNLSDVPFAPMYNLLVDFLNVIPVVALKILSMYLEVSSQIFTTNGSIVSEKYANIE